MTENAVPAETMKSRPIAVKFMRDGNAANRAIKLMLVGMNDVKTENKEFFHDSEQKLWGNNSSTGRVRIKKFGEPDDEKLEEVLKATTNGSLHCIYTVVEQGCTEAEWEETLDKVLGRMVRISLDISGVRARELSAKTTPVGTAHADGTVTSTPVVQPHRNGAEVQVTTN